MKMSNEDAVELLQRDIHNAKVAHHESRHYNIAICHIKAWDKVKEEIKNTVTFNNVDELVEVIMIIDKHLQEVENNGEIIKETEKG